ncbi:MAG: transcription termination/antitermination protein NusG [Chitinophagales bacterium]|jgi:transcriptional antiterminator NusG|nr:transcription termination/antitermination protein NusG [Sphingobacteriales bacterium]
MDNKKWFVLKVISGQENKIKGYIDSEIVRSKWENAITTVLVPTEKVYKIKAGKKVIKDKTLYPGYMYIEVEEKLVTPEMLATIRNISGAMNFLGGNQPQALRPAEVQKLLGKLDEVLGAGESMMEPFIINESVKIIDGPFNDFVGSIEEINEEKKKLKVVVKIFGRRQPVEVSFGQVDKIS